MHTTHTHTAREGFCSNYNHTKPSHIQWRQWDEYFFFCKGSCDKGRDLCVLMFESWCVCYSVNCFYGWERERSNEWERETDTQIPSYALGLIAFLQGVSSVVKRRGVNSSQSVIPGWRSFLSTLKPCMNKTPGQYQDHPSVISSLKLQF